MKEIVKENLKPVIFIVIVLVLAAISAYPQRKFAGRVVEVIDGKTCVVEVPGGRLTIVLQYIEIPEPEQPLHQTVKEHLQGLVLGKTIEYIPRSLMRGAKTIGRIFVKGVDVGQQMLRDGAAWYAVDERSGQDEAESLLYLDNEKQAKMEKRGVWGIENLKPAWEFRAEQAALREKEELKRLAFLREMQGRNSQLSRPAKTVPQVEMWADVGGADEYDQPLGFGGLQAGYDPSDRVGHISTPSIYLDFPSADFLQKVESRLFYLYRGDKTSIEESIYVLGFITTSKNFMFVNSNNLTITADAQSIALGRAKRFYRQDADSVKELLIYRITRAQIMKIVEAQKIGVQIGKYKGRISTDSLMFVNNLLNAS